MQKVVRRESNTIYLIGGAYWLKYRREDEFEDERDPHPDEPIVETMSRYFEDTTVMTIELSIATPVTPHEPPHYRDFIITRESLVDLNQTLRKELPLIGVRLEEYTPNGAPVNVVITTFDLSVK